MKEKLKNYISAGCPVVCLVSHEETRAEAEIAALAKDLGFTLYVWTVTSGITCVEKSSVVPDSEDPASMLDKFSGLPEKSILLAKDLHLFFAESNPVLIRKAKEACVAGKQGSKTLVTLGCQMKLPPELEKDAKILEFSLPGKTELLEVLSSIASGAGLTLNGNTDAILDAASGLTTIEAEDAFAISVVESKSILPEIVSREKSMAVKKNGILEIIENKENPDNIGGLGTFKEWIGKRKFAFGKKAREYGLPVPKGVMAVGIPGSGKTATAKACASVFGVPLLKLDGGKLFGSLVGESERNMRTAIQTAEAIAPCVLLIDEIEKAFSGTQSSGQTDGGTASRVFGTFLQWLNDKTSPVFVFATANGISQLPPELMRKGRFDELFFVDLPNDTEREEIWKIHICKKARNPENFNIQKLASNSDGFTGAEIEAALADAMFAAFDDDKEVADPYIVQAISQTVPLSKTMGDQIEALRTWAKGRARFASGTESKTTPKTTRKIINN